MRLAADQRPTWSKELERALCFTSKLEVSLPSLRHPHSCPQSFCTKTFLGVICTLPPSCAPGTHPEPFWKAFVGGGGGMFCDHGGTCEDRHAAPLEALPGSEVSLESPL